MSRRTALEQLTMSEYKEAMQGIYSTCVLPETLDESPMAYKSINDILKHLSPTAEVVGRLKPIYNFKAAE